MDTNTILYFLESSFSRDDSFLDELKTEIESDYNTLGEKIKTQFSNINQSDLHQYESQITKLRHLRKELRTLLGEI